MSENTNRASIKAATSNAETSGNSQDSVQVAVVAKSARKMNYKEFILDKGFRKEFLAGFKMYLNGIEFMSEEDWNKKLEAYNTRR